MLHKPPIYKPVNPIAEQINPLVSLSLLQNSASMLRTDKIWNMKILESFSKVRQYIFLG